MAVEFQECPTWVSTGVQPSFYRIASQTETRRTAYTTSLRLLRESLLLRPPQCSAKWNRGPPRLGFIPLSVTIKRKTKQLIGRCPFCFRTQRIRVLTPVQSAIGYSCMSKSDIHGFSSRLERIERPSPHLPGYRHHISPICKCLNCL